MMPGLLAQGQMPQGQAAPQGQMPPEPMPQGQQDKPMMEKPATQTTDQEAFDKFVINGLKILHEPQMTDKIAQAVSRAEDPVDTIGDVSLMVVERLEASAVDEKFNMNASAVINGMNAIVGEVINIAEATGIQPLTEDQKFQAFSWTLSNYLGNAVDRGDLKKEDLVSLGEQMAQTPEGQKISGQVAQRSV